MIIGLRATYIELNFDSPSSPSLREERDDCDAVAIRVSNQKTNFILIIMMC